MNGRMPVISDEFGCEIDDFRQLPNDEIEYMLGAQITGVSYEPPPLRRPPLGCASRA